MKDFRKELYKRFEGNPHLDFYARHIYRAGTYDSLGHLSEDSNKQLIIYLPK
jgi:hypothetical protein